MILNKLLDLGNIPSTNDKIDYLIENECDTLKQVLEMSLNKYKRYGYKVIPEYTIEPEPTKTLQFALDFIEQWFIGNHRSNYRDIQLSQLLSYLTEQDAEVLKRVVLKKLKCNVGVGLANKAFPKLIPEFDVLLAKQGKEKNIKRLVYPAYVQIKYDGGRVNMDIDSSGGLTVYARSGNILNLHGRFDSEFPYLANNKMVDGEILGYRNGVKMPRQESNGIVTKAIRGTITEEETKLLRFVAWDIVERGNFLTQNPQNTPYVDRFEQVEFSLNDYSEIVFVAENRIVNSFEEVLEFFNEAIERGEEGIVIKNLNGIWELTRSNDIVKMKAEKDADLVVVAINEGEGGRLGKLGSFTLETSDGLLRVNCGSGLNHEQSIEYFTQDMIGCIVEVVYNEILSNKKNDMKSLFLPIFKQVRYDKTVANKLEELK